MSELYWIGGATHRDKILIRPSYCSQLYGIHSFYLQLLLVAEDRPVKIVLISNPQGLKVERAEQKFANVHPTFVRYFT